MSKTLAEKMDTLLRIMTCLRDPDSGCPWDLQQDYRSIAPHTLEEAFEVVDAIESGDLDHLRNELGDLLFQVVFLSRLAEEEGQFAFPEVLDEIIAKLLQRHPHVFPEGTLESAGKRAGLDAEQVSVSWEAIKQRERDAGKDAPASVLDDVPMALPALQRARKLRKRAATVGFDWPHTQGVLGKLREELAELEAAMAEGSKAAMEDELGDLIFATVNLARHLKVDPETALRSTNRKFERRFRYVEDGARESGREVQALSLDEMEALWQAAKQGE